MARQEDIDKARGMLEEVSVLLYDIRLSIQVEPYYSALLDSVRDTVDECIKLVQ